MTESELQWYCNGGKWDYVVYARKSCFREQFFGKMAFMAAAGE
jgi:hypothetical protein